MRNSQYLEFSRHRCEICQRVFEDRPCYHAMDASPRLCSEQCVFVYVRSSTNRFKERMRLLERVGASTVKHLQYAGQPLVE